MECEGRVLSTVTVTCSLRKNIASKQHCIACEVPAEDVGTFFCEYDWYDRAFSFLNFIGQNASGQSAKC